MIFHRTALVLVTLAAAVASMNAQAVANVAAASHGYVQPGSPSFTAGEPTPAEMLLLGTMLDDGFGVPRNYEQAVKWYERAAQAGQAEAMNRLGVMHATGHGVPRDHALAFAWFGTAVRNPEHYLYEFQLADIAELWRRGSVVASWLLDLSAKALLKDPDLKDFSGHVSDSGEGRWTLTAAIDEGTPAPVLTAALNQRSARVARMSSQPKCCRPCDLSSAGTSSDECAH